MKIKINATDQEGPDQPLTYEKVVELANTDKQVLHTVCYCHKVPFEQLPGERSGTLTPGKSVSPTEAMVIDAVVTGRA